MDHISHYTQDVLPAVDPRTYPTGLSQVERAAVLLARSDDLASTGGVKAGRLKSFVFGGGRRNALADPQLEGLRRFAVAVAHDKHILAEWERAELIGSGYTHFQLDEAAEIAESFRRAASSRGIRAARTTFGSDHFAEIRRDLRAAVTTIVAAVALAGITAAIVPFWLPALPPTVTLSHHR